MAAHRAFGSSSFEGGRRRAARPLAAFWLGAAIAAAGLALGAANDAWARESFVNFASRVWLHSEPLAPPSARQDTADDAPRRHRRQRIALGNAASPRASYAGRAAVCVRLCDGYFFPAPAADPAAACDSLCPDAPTEVYYRNGSDKIEDAVSARGQRYAALPVALRYRTTADATCSCHRDPVAYAPLRDATLKRGDAVMTPAGFVVFQGAGGGAHRPADFVALSGAPAGQRAALQAMEKVSVAKVHPRLSDWLVAETASPLARHRIERVAVRTAKADDRIRVLVWRNEAQN